MQQLGDKEQSIFKAIWSFGYIVCMGIELREEILRTGSEVEAIICSIGTTWTALWRKDGTALAQLLEEDCEGRC